MGMSNEHVDGNTMCCQIFFQYLNKYHAVYLHILINVVTNFRIGLKIWDDVVFDDFSDFSSKNMILHLVNKNP